jgi:hypothetical protein
MLRMVFKGKAFGGHDQHPPLDPLLFRCIVKRTASAFYWGLVATSSLIVGGLLGSWWTPIKRTLGVVMAFEAGVLISAVSYELVFEAIHLAKLTGFPAMGLFAGAFTFFFCDQLIGKIGASDRMAIEASHQPNLVIPLVLAGIFTLLGFAVSVWVIVLERSAAG